MWKRLKSRCGESLFETLVALMIASLSMMMFAGMISSAVRLTLKGRDWNNEISNSDAVLETKSGGSTEGTITIMDASNNMLISDTTVDLYRAHYGGEDVIAYEKQGDDS